MIALDNMQGRMINELINGIFSEGYHSVVWNATDYSSGVYFVRLSSDEKITTQKIMLVK